MIRLALGTSWPIINMLKLCVGAETVEDLLDWQASQRAPLARRPRRPRHPHVAEARGRGAGRRLALLGDQGRDPRPPAHPAACEEVTGGDGIPRCALVLDPEVIRTEAAPRRPFQGWRYLDPKDSPRDLRRGREAAESLPPRLAAALAEIGLR